MEEIKPIKVKTISVLCPKCKREIKFKTTEPSKDLKQISYLHNSHALLITIDKNFGVREIENIESHTENNDLYSQYSEFLSNQFDNLFAVLYKKIAEERIKKFMKNKITKWKIKREIDKKLNNFYIEKIKFASEQLRKILFEH